MRSHESDVGVGKDVTGESVEDKEQQYSELGEEWIGK